MKQRLFLVLFLFTCFFSSISFSQNEVKYEIDTLFVESVRPLYEQNETYKIISVWLERIDETIKKRKFYDFELALRNYRRIKKAQMNIDSLEIYTNRLFNYLDNSAIPVEYKILLAFNINKIKGSDFKYGEESLKWKFKGRTQQLNKMLADSLDQELQFWKNYPVESFLKYEFPYSMDHQNFLHFFFDYYHSFPLLDNQNESAELLLQFYAKSGYWFEYVALNDYLWVIKGEKGQQNMIAFIDEHKDNEYVSASVLMMLVQDIYRDKAKLKKLSDENFVEMKRVLDDFVTRYPNSVFVENMKKIQVYFHSTFFEAKLQYSKYNTPTIVSVEGLNFDKLYYYHFIRHDSRAKLDSLPDFKFHQSGIWKVKDGENVKKNAVFALPAVAAVAHILIVSEKEITDFSPFEKSVIGKVKLPFQGNILLWTEHPYLIKKSEESFVNYLIVQDLNTGGPLKGILVYNGDGSVRNKTNAQGIVAYKRSDSLHYMIHNQDTFAVEQKMKDFHRFRESLIDWDEVGEWFWRFEWYGIKDRREDVDFDGFTDRSRYKPGDTVYYKAFANLQDDRVDHDRRIPYFLNKTSVALVGPDQKLIASDTIPINGTHSVYGLFVIPQDAKLGHYSLNFNTNRYRSYSGIGFYVEDYVDQKYLLKVGKIKEAYQEGDTVAFITHVESRTGERIEGVKIEIIEKDQIRSVGVTNSKGEYVVKSYLDESKSLQIKAYLPTGEVLRESKYLSFHKRRYAISLRRWGSDSLKINLFNRDDVKQKDTTLLIQFVGKVNRSNFNKFKGDVQFTKEEFVKWYPHAMYEVDTLIRQEQLHTAILLHYDWLRKNRAFELKCILENDTVNLNTNYLLYKSRSSAFQYIENVPTKMNWKMEMISLNQELTYLKRKLNGHFSSKNIVFNNGRNRFINRKVNKATSFELFSKDGLLNYEEFAFKFGKYIKPRKSSRIIWDSLPQELYPGQEYTIGFKVKKKKRFVGPEAALFMVKEEHVQSYYSLPERIVERRYPNHKKLNSWNWLRKESVLLTDIDSTIYRVLGDVKHIGVHKKGDVYQLEGTGISKELNEVMVVRYKTPLITKDGGPSGMTISREDIVNLPVRDASGVARTVGGVNDDGGLSIRGSREDGSYYYIDGVKVRGSSELPKSALLVDDLYEITGGVPASFGDVTGGIEEDDKMLSFDQIRERNRFGDTQFFIPAVKRKGKRYEVTFTQNDEITAWELIAIAGTRNYQYTQGRQRLISVQPVQLIENTPRFVRVGDTVVIGGNIFNRTADTLAFKPTLNIYNSLTKMIVNDVFGVQEHPIVKVAPNQTQNVEWKVNIPTYYLKTLDLEMAVAGKQHGDRFNKSIPVLQRKGIYEVGQTFVKVEEDTLQFVVDKETYLSQTAEILDVNFYVNGNKEIEYLIQRGKALEYPTLITSTGLASNWALTAELHEMIAAKPALKILLDREFKAVIDSIDVNKKDALKVVDFSKRLFVIMQLQELSNKKNYDEIAKKRSEELVKFMDEEGVYKWLQKSEEGSDWATRSVIRSLAKIKYLQLPVEEKLYDKWAKGIEEELKRYVQDNTTPYWRWSFFYELDNYAILSNNWSEELTTIWKKIQTQTWKDRETSAQIYFSNLTLKMKDVTFADQIAKSILSYTSYSKSKGRFIPKQSRGSELQNQAELILLLEKLGGYNREIVQLQQYMQIHQDYNDWSSKPANASYLRALICGPSQEHLLNKNATIIINQKRTDLELTKNHAVDVDVTQEKYEIAVISHPDLVVTGGFKVKFSDEMDKVNRSTDDRLRMERFIYYKEGNVWKLANENAIIPLGSTIRMDIEFAASNEFSHLIVELPRITGLEFNNSQSGYRYGQMRYYAEMKNELVRLFVDRIRDGKSTISLEGVVTNAGTFLFAPSSLTSEQNPEIGVTDKSLNVKISR